ncbi:lig_chan-Glu_bd domain-containing protein [Nephila pilipes]|uniref:Lig_chan-Glu_bd domain-containing protein n=1 Tax=Nephila pilipes TaxID=299642 RepID=A0A8X6P5R6_NEPPI|nr:lig_chan-Glu_bd domain-containing protein [Nephila pilipes]
MLADKLETFDNIRLSLSSGPRRHVEASETLNDGKQVTSRKPERLPKRKQSHAIQNKRHPFKYYDCRRPEVIRCCRTSSQPWRGCPVLHQIDIYGQGCPRSANKHSSHPEQEKQNQGNLFLAEFYFLWPLGELVEDIKFVSKVQMKVKDELLNMRAVYSNLPPFVIVKIVNGSTVLDGFIPDIVRAVTKKMNWNVTFIREPYDNYGSWENNTWTGMVGMLHRNEVDFILNPVMAKERILEFAYFTNPITIEAFTILSGKKIQEAGFFLYFSVLNSSVWLTMIVALIAVAVTSAILYVRLQKETKYLSWIATISEYSWNFLSHLLKQSPTEKYFLRKNREYLSIFLPLLAILWIAGIGLVMTAFQSLLVTKLTLSKSQPYVDTMADLLKTEKTAGIVPVEIKFEEILENSGIPVYEAVFEKIRKNFLPQSVVFSDETMKKVQNGKFCIFHGHLILKNKLSDFFKKYSFCQMHLSDNYFFPFSLPIAIHRKFPRALYENFNYGVTRLVDADITGKTFKNDLEGSKLCTSYSDTTLRPLGIKNIYGVLIMWTAGLVSATLAFVCEILSNRYKRLNNHY